MLEGNLAKQKSIDKLKLPAIYYLWREELKAIDFVHITGFRHIGNIDIAQKKSLKRNHITNTSALRRLEKRMYYYYLERKHTI